MKSQLLFAAVIAAAVAAPLTAQAQGVPGGFAHGASEGWRIAGPIGAVVGAPVGGVIGGVEGLLGIGPAYREPPPQVAPRRVVRTSGNRSRRSVVGRETAARIEHRAERQTRRMGDEPILRVLLNVTCFSSTSFGSLFAPASDDDTHDQPPRQTSQLGYALASSDVRPLTQCPQP